MLKIGQKNSSKHLWRRSCVELIIMVLSETTFHFSLPQLTFLSNIVFIFSVKILYTRITSLSSIDSWLFRSLSAKQIHFMKCLSMMIFDILKELEGIICKSFLKEIFQRDFVIWYIFVYKKENIFGFLSFGTLSCCSDGPKRLLILWSEYYLI